ncbi:MAG: mechanosensitive ion channel domain-containing protein [Candidatus Woesearchaeota archaeon]|jgi:small-conductance mechanosensitive channel
MILDAGKFISDPNVRTILIVILIVSLFALIVDIMRRRLYVHFKDKANNLTKKLLRLETPILLMIIVLGTQIVTSKMLRDYSELQTTVNKLIGSIIIIIITYILILISELVLERWSSHLGKSNGSNSYEGIVPLAKSVLNILLSFIALFFVLQLWGVSITALLTSLGIVGVVLGFAFKDAFNHIFGGISMIMDDSFRKGELIELPDGEKGYIQEVSVRSTKIKNLDGMIVTIPNGLLANMRIKNYARPSKYIKLKQIVTIPIGSDASKVEFLLLELLKDKDGILDYPKPAITFLKMNEKTLDFELSFYINDYHDNYSSQIKSEVMTDAYLLLISNNIISQTNIPLAQIDSKKEANNTKTTNKNTIINSKNTNSNKLRSSKNHKSHKKIN